jgi:hypothetical protein
MNLKPGKNRRTTPEGEPLEDASGGGGFPGGGRGGFFRGPGIGKGSNSLIKIVIPAVIGIIVVAFLS